MDVEPVGKLPQWIVGMRYEKGSRVRFRGWTWIANWYTELRPGLGKAWRREES